jgi:hypothetical protein
LQFSSSWPCSAASSVLVVECIVFLGLREVGWNAAEDRNAV